MPLKTSNEPINPEVYNPATPFKLLQLEFGPQIGEIKAKMYQNII